MRKIVVVDDEPDILLAVQLILSRAQFDVKILSQWEKIPQLIDSFNPELIILDVSLRGGDGREICRQLKESTTTQHIKIILFSAYHKVEDNLKEYKPDAFIAKPFEAGYLINTVLKVLD